jgi:hypothetical protein
MKQKGRVDVEELYRRGKFWLRNKKENTIIRISGAKGSA